jgi:hypothetical protein
LFNQHQQLINLHTTMIPTRKFSPSRRTLSVALLAIASAFAALVVTPFASLQAIDGQQNGTAVATEPTDTPEVAAFRQAVGGSIVPLIVELKREPAVLRKIAEEKAGRQMSLEDIIAYSQELIAQQNSFLAGLQNEGVRALLRTTDVKQINGSNRHIQYRFTYLLNGFVAFVAMEDVEKLKALPDVAYRQRASEGTVPSRPRDRLQPRHTTESG